MFGLHRAPSWAVQTPQSELKARCSSSGLSWLSLPLDTLRSLRPRHTHTHTQYVEISTVIIALQKPQRVIAATYCCKGKTLLCHSPLTAPLTLWCMYVRNHMSTLHQTDFDNMDEILPLRSTTRFSGLFKWAWSRVKECFLPLNHSLGKHCAHRANIN